MENQKRNLKVLSVFLAGSFLLSACSSSSIQSPKEVMTQFKENVKTIKSVDMTALAEMTGVDESDQIDFDFKADVKMDRLDESMRKVQVALGANGTMKASDQLVAADVQGEVRVIGDKFYFNLGKFEVSDPAVEQYKAMIDNYLGKWQHLASDFVPEEVKQLQEVSDEAKQKEAALKELFVNTRLFEVIKEYGVEKLNGVDVYHYGIKVNKDGLKDYMMQASEINEQPMTQAEIDEATAFVDAITNIDMWIGESDYYLYKAVVNFSGENAGNAVKTNMTFTYTAQSYNKPLSIEAPESSDEFNPISLLMGMQMGGAGMMEGGAAMEEGVMMDDGEQ